MLKMVTFILALIGLTFMAEADPIHRTKSNDNVKIVVDPAQSSLLWEGYPIG